MSIKFLSPEWADALTEALNADEGFRNETRKRESTVAWKVDSTPQGEVEYHLVVDKGTSKIVLAPPPAKPDVQLYCSYDTLVGVMTGKLQGREAFQSKELRSDSRLITILKYLGIFHEMNRVTAGLDVEY